MSASRRRAAAAAARPKEPVPLPAPGSAERREMVREAYEALQAGGFEAARDRIGRAPADSDFELLLLWGLALGGAGDAEASARALNLVAAARPAAMHPVLDLVSLLTRQHRGRMAEPVYRACLALSPDNVKLLLGFAQHLYELLRFDAAMEMVDAAMRLEPKSVPGRNQHAIVLVAQGRIAEALAAFRAIVADDPRNAAAWANLGCTLTAEGAFEEALSAYRASILAKPGDAQVRLNHSICLLKAGRMVQGWTEHEWRLQLPGHTQLPLDRMLPNLVPGSDLKGKRVLVTHEEGVGDTLMFLRYVPLLAALGADVTLWVPRNLARLAARVTGVAGVVVGDRISLDGDWHCPFISLPRVFAGTSTPWGAPAPYLRTDHGRVGEAGRQMPATRSSAAWGPARERPRLRIGLVWGGAPRFDNLSANMIDQKRSMSLQHLAPLAALRDVQLVNLQFGPYARELRDPPDGLALHDPMEFVQDMDDTASLMRNLDVVVSVDTSMAHLAGGLGLPVILMDRYDNCWRWFHGRADSPWYPTMRIVRQDRPGDWDGVVARVVPMLQAMADEKHARA